MSMNFGNLSDIDFEELARDVLGRSLNVRFEAFGPGPDGGIDGRHAKGRKKTVLQAKHYIGSQFSNLKSAAKKEKPKIDKLKPNRYLFVTSLGLTPKQKSELEETLRPHIKDPKDIWCRQDFESFFKRQPEVLKSHMKLWLSETAILEKIMHSGFEAFTDATEEEILDELRVYVLNPSFDQGIKKLEREKILIVSGPPGVGKTTLARMLAYHYLNSGWRFVAIKDLDDGFIKLNDREPTVIFFDDFLGRVSLNRQSLTQSDSAFAIFTRKIRRAKNTRFILTTRAHIFEEARGLSDYIDDKKLQMSKYLLDVGIYTRRVKANILYNHLAASAVPQAHIEALLQNDHLRTIVDHKNYNPRIIASVSSELSEKIAAKSYPKYVIRNLENPDLIWEKPYHALDVASQNLLMTMFFCSEYGEETEILRDSFTLVNERLSKHYGHSFSPYDFDRVLKNLESGFLGISGQTVSFVNPSLRDFLKTKFKQKKLFILLAEAANSLNWLNSLWNQSKTVSKTGSKFRREIADIFAATKCLREARDSDAADKFGDMQTLQGLSLVIDLWIESKNRVFRDVAIEISKSVSKNNVDWTYFSLIPQIVWEVRNFAEFDGCDESEIVTILADVLAQTLDGGVAIDDLTTARDSIEEYFEDNVPEVLEISLNAAMDYELANTSEAIYNLDTEGELADYAETLETLAAKMGRDVSHALESVGEKLVEIENGYERQRSPFRKKRKKRKDDTFGDGELRSLFGTFLKN